MKKILLALMCIFLSYSADTLAQSENKVIEVKLKYQPAHKNLVVLPDDISLKNGREYKFVITNINSAIYEGKMEIGQYTIVSEVPDFAEAVAPYLNLISPLAKSAETSNAENLEDIGAVADPMEEPDSNFLEISGKAFISLQYLLDAANSLYKTNASLQNDEFKVKDYQALANALFNEIEGMELKTENDVMTMIKIIEVAHEQVKMIVGDDKNVQTSDLLTYSKIKGMQETVASNKQKYIKSLAFIKKSMKADSTIASVVRESKKDVVRVKVTLVDAYKKDTVLQQTIDFNTFGRWKISFYTGSFYNNLVEEEFYISPKDTVVSYVASEGVNRRDISFGGMGVLEYSVHQDFSFGPAIGASISPFDGNVRFLAGLSTSFGRMNRLGIQFGYAWSKMKHLSAAVKVDEETNRLVVPASVTTVPTYKKVKDGWFLGISYSIGKIQLN